MKKAVELPQPLKRFTISVFIYSLTSELSLDAYWDDDFDAKVPAHVKYTYSAGHRVDRIVFEPVHIVHIGRIKEIVYSEI